MFASDFNGDDNIDIAITHGDTSAISILFNNGDGSFLGPVMYQYNNPNWVPYYSWSAVSLFAGDFDGDEDNDLAICHHGTNQVSILTNDSSGVSSFNSLKTVGEFPWHIYGADLDGDMDIELVAANWQSDDITILHNVTGPYDSYICGDADGSGSVNILDVTCLISYLYKSGAAPVAEEAGDANGNGAINILDATYLINYLYKGGPEPICP